MNPPNLDAEHEALKEQVAALQREHDALERRPFSEGDHHEHIAKLRAKILELRAHLKRIQADHPKP